ncbi:MAG: SH3 domain-containing protein [Oscillospiraceae bacterium]|nr:SH3 domain-containing protein [Oscillospiraceae bacterium]
MDTDGRRINQKQRKYNPLFVLFLCLIAAVIVLLIVSVVLGVKLGMADKQIKASEAQVHELEQTVAQLESDLDAALGQSGGETASADGSAAEQTEQTEPVQQPAEQSAEPQEPVQQPAEQSTEKQEQSSSWLDLSGHSELKYKPTNLLDGYQTYYTSNGVNLRSGPGTGYGRIALVNKGTKVQVAARENGWSFVKVEGKFGWISSDYLSKTTPVAETETTARTETTTRTEATSGSLRTQ